MRVLTLFILGLLATSAHCTTQYRVFISFSMPKHLLEETIEDASRHGIPVMLNGFYNDSMRETAAKIFELSKKNPALSLQIDPTAFERYHINQVPALVADDGHHMDVVFGNITIERGLDEIKRFGDTARKIL